MKYFFSFCASLMFAVYPIFMKLVLNAGLSINILNFYYAFISVLSMLLIIFLKTKNLNSLKINRKEFCLSFLNTGILGLFLTNISISLSLNYISPSIRQAITSSYPIIIILFHIFIFKNKIIKRDILNIFLILCGLFLILGRVETNNISMLVKGCLIATISALSIAIYSTILAKFPSQLDNYVFWFYSYLGLTFSALISYFLSNETGIIINIFSNTKLFLILFSTIFITYTFSNVFYVIGIKKVGILKNSIINTTTIIYIIILDILLFNYRITFLQLFGVFLIILSSFVNLIIKEK